MRKMILKYSVCAIIVPILCACATSQPALQGQLSDDFGAAMKQNITAHAVAPTPEQKANTFIPANAKKTALARKNYEEGTEPKPKTSGY